MPPVKSPDLAQPPDALASILGLNQAASPQVPLASPDDLASRATSTPPVPSLANAPLASRPTNDTSGPAGTKLAPDVQGPSPAQPPSLLHRLGQTLGGAFLGESGTPDNRRGNAIGQVFRGLAGAEGLAQGNQAVKQGVLENERLNAELPLRAAQIGMMNQYHLGQLGIGQQRADTAQDIAGTRQQMADTAQSKVDSSMRARGYVPDEGLPGGYRPMNEDEILNDPILSQNQDLKQAAVASKLAGTQLSQARQDALMNPNNPTLQLKAKEIESRYRLAQAQMSIRQLELEAHGRESMWQYGENPQTGEQLSPQNAPPGMLTLPNGQPVPTRQTSIYSPTQQMKNVASQAKTTADAIPSVIKEVDELRDSIGPVAGRWNEFMQGKVGLDNPAFAGLRADLMMLASGVALAHARGRLPENLREEFDSMINAPQQDPNNIISVLTHIQPWMERMGQMASQSSANPPIVPPSGGKAGPNSPGQPKTSANPNQPAATHRFNPQTGKIEAIGGGQ
jgi:hypothetical protein